MFAFFERLVDPFPAAPPKGPPDRLWAFVWYYAKPVWPLLLVYAIGTALVSVAEVSLFGFLGRIVDWLSASDPETFLREEGTRLALIGGLVLVGLPLLTFLTSLISFQAMFGNFPMRFRWSVHTWLLDQSLGYFQDEFAGRIAAKLMQTALAVRETVMKSIGTMLYIAVYFTGIVVVMTAADWRLILPFVGWFALYVVLLRTFIPRLMGVAAVQADARAEMTGRVVDAYSNIGTVKLFAHTAREAEYARGSMREFLVSVYGQGRMINLFFSFLYALNCLLLFAVGALGIALWTTGAVGVGAVAVGIGLVLRLNGMSQWVMWEVSELFENIGTIRDGMASFTQPVALLDKPGAKPLAVPHGDIRFENVSFSYAAAAANRPAGPVVDGVTLHVRPGEKIGLVGRSGAGKSTLLNLLLRFHDLEGGRILIDGQDISQVTQNSLREAIGVVTQDTSLLHRSIGDNILYGRPNASHDDLSRAMDRAEARGFIEALADRSGGQGLAAEVGERGVKLSGGQRQRIAIARVMLKDAPILLLDEATSALDSEVEAAIQENLYRLMEGKTVIAVAHRLSTIAALDRLVVLEAGRIAEMGTHAELLERNGLYARLWQRQVGGFLDPVEDTEETPTKGGVGRARLKAAE